MATVTFTTDLPDGLRLQALFADIVGGIDDVSFGTSDGNDTATFKVLYFKDEVEVFYSGSQLSNDKGEVYLRFSFNGATWLTIGALDGPPIFTYGISDEFSTLEDFHRSGAIAAAIVLAGADNLVGSAKGDFIESMQETISSTAAPARIRFMADRATTLTSSIIRLIASSRL